MAKKVLKIYEQLNIFSEKIKMKRKLKSISKIIYNKLFSNDIDKVIYRINSNRKNFRNADSIEKSVNLSKDYFKLYKDNPFFNFNHSIILQNYSKNPNDGFKLFEKYEKNKNSWLNKNLLKNLNEDFIPYQQLLGSLGNHNPLFYYLIYKKLILKNKSKSNLLINSKSKFTNPSLAKYFLKNLNVIKSDYFYEKINFLYELKKVPLEFTSPFKGIHYPWFATVNFIRQSLSYTKNNLKKNLFSLSKEDQIKGSKILKKLGVPKSKWFVTLHVREGKGNSLFNSSPKTYIKAIDTIVKTGGYVIRVGDKSMTKLPKINGLIDYPFTEQKSDFMDVYLAAKNEFCIGTSSGYWSLPTFFGKPVVLTNYLPHFDYFMLDEKSVFLPKRLFNIKKKKYIPFKESFSFPLGYMCTNYQLEKNSIKDIDNTSEEINCAVKEMLFLQNKIHGKKTNSKFIKKNKLLKKDLKKTILNNYKIELKPFGYFSSAINL